MIKHIVFDMGNVLISYKPKDMLKKYLADENDQEILFNELFHSVDWLKFDRGTIRKEAFKVNVSHRVPAHLKNVAFDLLDNWYKEIHPINEMESIIHALKEEDFNLYILSNASSDFHYFKTKIPNFNQFDGVFLSSDWKMLKPEKEIYQAFYSHFNLNPSECFFIDDMPANIESASNTGMNGYVFKNDFQQLTATLNALNQ